MDRIHPLPLDQKPPADALEFIAEDMEVTGPVLKDAGCDMLAAPLKEYAAVLRKNAKVIRRQQELYFELIMEVAEVVPGETRHETARRYIRERAERHEGPASEKPKP